jgi:hypothetical protein
MGMGRSKLRTETRRCYDRASSWSLYHQGRKSFVLGPVMVVMACQACFKHVRILLGS